jgi:hypothetical protein
MIRARTMNGDMHSPPRPPAPWAWVLVLLALGMAARILVALNSSGLAHPDEVFQYLEQGYRVVHGYGVTPWEYVYGIRNWLIGLVLAGLLWGLGWLGLDTPATYGPAVEVVFCILSMSLPLAIHAFCRNTLGPRVAVFALAIACFWPDFLLFASKPMPDALATYTIFVALAMASGGAGRARLIGVGVLAGLTIILRYQMLPFIGAFGLYYMYTLGARAIWPVLGLLLGLALGGAIDAVTWWGPFSSFVENFRLNITYRISELFGKAPALFYAGYFTINTLGLALPGLVGLALAWRRLWPYLLAAAIGFVAMHIPAHKEYRFLFWLLPFGVVGLAFLLHWLLERTGARAGMARLAGVGLGVWIAAASLFISVGYLDRAPYTSPVYAGRCNDAMQVTRFLSERDHVMGVYGGVGYVWWCAGGYYHLGSNIPVYPVAWHSAMREIAASDPDRYLSHWVSLEDDAPAGWPEIARIGDFIVSENPRPPAMPIFPEGWTYAAPRPKGMGDIPVSGEIRFP